jgi:hypothetical protein
MNRQYGQQVARKQGSQPATSPQVRRSGGRHKILCQHHADLRIQSITGSARSAHPALAREDLSLPDLSAQVGGTGQAYLIQSEALVCRGCHSCPFRAQRAQVRNAVNGHQIDVGLSDPDQRKYFYEPFKEALLYVYQWNESQVC